MKQQQKVLTSVRGLLLRAAQCCSCATMHALHATHLAFRPLRRVKVGGATAGVRMPLHTGDHEAAERD